MSDERDPSVRDGAALDERPQPATAQLQIAQLDAARQQAARLADIGDAVGARVRRDDAARRRLHARLVGAGLLALMFGAYALNPGRDAHQAAAFAEVVARNGGAARTAQRLVERVGWRTDGFRLLPIERVNLGLFSLGRVEGETLTVGVLGQVYVLPD